MNAPAVAIPTEVTLADLAFQRDDLRSRKKALEDQVKVLDEQLKDNEGAIIELLDAQGVTRSGVGPYSMSISETTVANATDWDATFQYIAEHEAWHLVQRRVANAAYSEMLDQGLTVPGLEPFTKRSLNFRKSSK